MRHTVVLSDIHLAEAEPGTGLWMRYRQKDVSPDREIAAMLTELLDKVRGQELTLVLNGDVFDFDAPLVVDHESVFHDLPRNAPNAVPMVKGILDDHEPLVEALGRVLNEGHAIVFISGNHDVQLTLPEVREAVAERVIAAAMALRKADAHADGRADGRADAHADAHADARVDARAERAARASLKERVLFRAWFHKTQDGIVIEHGNQYDPFCCYRYPMEPFGREKGTIQPTLGSLVARLLASRMGYFNPHVDESCMLSAWGYLKHWARFYLFSRRSLAAAWVSGAVRAIVEIMRWREPLRRERRRQNIAACARETGVPLKTVAKHARLFATPAEEKLAFAIRELWLDRLALFTIAAIAASVWLLLAPGLLSLLAVVAPALVVLYELTVPKTAIDAIWARVGRAARGVAKAHHAKAVVFGHTHHPEGAWEDGVFFGNTGSWSAAYKDVACTQPLFDERPLVWLTSGAPDGALRGGLASWKEGRFQLRVTSAAPSAAGAPVGAAGAAGVAGAATATLFPGRL